MGGGALVMSDLRAVRTFLSALRPDAVRLAVAAALSAGALGSGVALLATSAWLISAAALMPPILVLTVAIVGVRFFGISRGVLRYAERLVSHDAALRSLGRLRERVVVRLMEGGPGLLPQQRRGDALVRLVADVDAAQDLPLRVILPMAASVLVGLGAVALATALVPAAGVVLGAALLIGIVLAPFMVTRAARAAEQEAAAARGQMGASIHDILESTADLVTSHGSAQAVARLLEAEDHLARAARRRARRDGGSTALVHASLGVTVPLMAMIGADALRAGTMDPRALAVLVLLPLGLLEAVTALPAAALAFMRVRASAERVDALMSSPVRVPPEPMHPADASRRGGALTADDLTITWPGAQTPAVHDLSMTVPPRSRVALVGPSGSGKSTFVAALLRFLDHEGRLAVDGVDVLALSDHAVRLRVTAVPQEAHVFDTSVRENLRLAAPEATDEDLARACDAAHLRDWFATLDAGWDTRLGQHGRGMSGGEQVRLGLARALLRQPDVLVLDEPTEHLDDATARAVMAVLLGAATEAHTVVLVTHRPFGLEDVDQVVRLPEPRYRTGTLSG